MLIKYKLGDVVKVRSERVDNPANCAYDKFVGLEHYVSGEIEIKKYGDTSILKSAMKVFKSGDILVARRNVYLKRASIVKFDGITSGDSIVLQVENKLLRKIIPFVLNTDEFWEYAEKFSDGTMSKRLSPKVLLEYEFVLPDIEEQEKLAELLWAANNTKEAYKKLLNLTDELVKAKFVDMFYGKEYPVTTIEKVVDRDIKRVAKVFTLEDEIEYLDISSIDNETKKVMKTTPYIRENAPSRAQYVLREGDILYSTVRPNLQNIAINPYNKSNIVGSTGFCVLRCNSVITEYMWGVITSDSFTNDMVLRASGANYPAVTDKVVLAYEIPLPPYEEQNKFSEFIKKNDKCKYELKNNISNLDKTIKAIMAKNFG